MKKILLMLAVALFPTTGHVRIHTRPERTSCEPVKGEKKHKCYRLIVFTIGDEKGEGKATKGIETPDNFEPFSYQEITNKPKVKKGMKTEDILRLFGKPGRVWEDDDEGTTYLYYQAQPFYGSYDTSMPQFHHIAKCHVVTKKGKVIKYDNFKFEYTESLK